MAFRPRTISEIYNSMMNEKTTKSTLTSLQPNLDTHQTFLSDLTSTSKVAIWRCFVWLMAFNTYLFEQIMDAYRREVDEVIANSHVGSIQWYVAKAKEFQQGYTLTLNDNYSIVYDTVDEDAQIIEFASGEEREGTFYLKVRRKDTDLLSESELTEFQSYINKIKFAGTRIVIVNEYSDKIKIYMDIVYDPLYDLTVLKTNVEDAINNYVQNIAFNSTFYVNSLVDAIQKVDGVIDPQVKWANSGVRTNTSNYIALPYIYRPVAGYLTVDTSYPLSTTLTYVKNS